MELLGNNLLDEQYARQRLSNSPLFNLQQRHPQKDATNTARDTASPQTSGSFTGKETNQ